MSIAGRRRWRLVAPCAVTLGSAALLACGGSSRASPDGQRAPRSIAILAGADQSGTVGAELPIALQVRVLDGGARPVAGVRVHFGVVAGDGSVRAGSALTGDDGVAEERWTLGTAAGANRLDASVDGLAPVTFAATATPGAAARLEKLAGDAQSAAPGVPLSVAPAVVVRDAFGNAVPRVAVTFTVTDGGGSASAATALAGDDGTASCGGWTLGVARGMNSLTAAVAGVPPVVFTAMAGVRSDAVTVRILAPVPGGLVGDASLVVARVTSTFQLSSVVASSGTSTSALAPGTYDGAPAWTGALPLDPQQPRGPVLVAVTATDVLGDVTDAFVSVSADRFPVVTLVAPREDALARPGLDVDMTCRDDDPAGCVTMVVGLSGSILARGVSQIERTVDLSAYDGESHALVFDGFDTAGQRTRITRRVYVDSSPKLALLAAESGAVCDIRGTRVLYLDETVSPAVLRIHDTATGATETVQRARDSEWPSCNGFLTPAGVVFAFTSWAAPACAAYDRRDGSTVPLGGIDSCGSLRVAGDHAIFGRAGTLVRRDLASGVDVPVTDDAALEESAVAENGDVVFRSASGLGVFRVRSGTTTLLTTARDEAGALVTGVRLVTDGVHVAYVKSAPGAGAGTLTFQVRVHDGSTETSIGPTWTSLPRAPDDYALGGGIVAYTRADTLGAVQVWRRTAAGDEPLTFFSSSSHVDAVGRDGTVVLTHGARRLRAAPGGAALDVSASFGTVLQRGDASDVILGLDALRLSP